MFIRRTTYKMAPEFDSAEGQHAFETEMRATMRPDTIEGLINTTHVPNDDGTWSVVAIWESSEIAKLQSENLKAAWGQHSAKLAGPPKIEAGGVSIHESW